MHALMPARPLRFGAAILVAALTGCAVAGPEHSNLSVVVVGEGRQNQGLTARLANELRAATLIERDSAGQLVGGLASSWRFVDEGRVLILRLRPVKWSDNRPLVANDVVASFRRAAQPPSPEPGFRLAGVEGSVEMAAGRRNAGFGVLAPTSRVVEVRLLAPAPQLLDWLAEPGLSVRRLDRPTLSRYRIAPATAQTAAAQTAAAQTAAAPAATPAQSGQKPGSNVQAPLLLTRLAEDASADARPDEVQLRAVRDAAAAIAGFRRGTTDIVIGEGLAGLLEARVQGRRDELRLDRLNGVYGWRINTRKGALADPALRRLLAQSIDRAAIARSFGLAAIQPEAGLLPASLRRAAAPASLTDTIGSTTIDVIEQISPLSPDAGPSTPTPAPAPSAAAVPATRPASAAPAPTSSAPTSSAPAPTSSAPISPAPAPTSPAPTLAERRAIVAAAVMSASSAAKPRPADKADPAAASSSPGDAPLLTLQLLVPPGREHAQVAQRVAADWSALGVQIVLVEADAPARAKLIARGDFDLAVDETSLAVPDAAALLDRFRCGRGAYCNDAADALLAAARMAPADQRPGQLAIVESILRESPPFIGLFGAVRWALVSPALDGWTSNSSGVHPLGRIGRGPAATR